VIYRHNGKGGPVRAGSAGEAARMLARREFGRFSRVESIWLAARGWTPGEWGGGEVVRKSWHVVIATAASPEQRYSGDYARRAREITLSDTGSSGIIETDWHRFRPVPDLLKAGPHRHAGVPPAAMPAALAEEYRDRAAAAAAWREESRVRKSKACAVLS